MYICETERSVITFLHQFVRKYYSFMALDQVYSSLLLCTNIEYKGVLMKMDVYFPLSTTKLELTTELELQLRIC